MAPTSPEFVFGPVLFSKPKKPVSSKDWEEQRENFTRLYAIENHSLRVTMVEMRRLYSFEATERQYKRRIAQWHLDKKVKDDEMRIMLRNQKQRKREGKKSIFTIRGRRVNPKKIEQFSHRDVSWKDSQSNGEPICLPQHIRCFTPNPSRRRHASKSEISQFDSKIGLAGSPMLSTSDITRLVRTKSDQKLQTDIKFGEPNISQPASVKRGEKAGDRTGIVTLPPISSLIGFSPGAKNLSEAFCGVDKETQAGSPLTTMKVFQSLDTVFHGLDVNFIDRDIQLGDIAGEETELNHHGSKIAYEIPKSLMPLPDALSKNPVKFLYFHHFINHTSKLLVTHDCLNNPFKTILPQMATSDSSLLNMFLAYSAIHRSALQGYSMPERRIYLYINEAIPILQQAISYPSHQVPMATIAVTIMMASMGYMFWLPSAPTVLSSASWRIHLKAAKKLIKLYWPPKRYLHDPTLWFLVQWFFRLDVQWLFRQEGSRGSSEHEIDKPLLFEIYGDKSWQRSHFLGDCRIQCFLGVTLRCLMRLTKAAELAREVSEEKSVAVTDESTTWEPSARITEEAVQLKADLELGVSSWVSQSTCPLFINSNSELLAEMNRQFQFAALIHLNRRVFRLQSSHPDVQGPVGNILNSIEFLNQKVGVNAALLYPLATAGCEALGPGQRNLALEQCRRIELVGHTCARGVRDMMQKLWTKQS